MCPADKQKYQQQQPNSASNRNVIAILFHFERYKLNSFCHRMFENSIIYKLLSYGEQSTTS
jgi:hypothetical protein